MKHKVTYQSHRYLLIILFLVASLTKSFGQKKEDLRDVHIGLFLADLVEISEANHSYLADVMLIASWKDSSLVDSSNKTRSVNMGDIWHPELLIVNQRNASKSLPEKLMIRPDGTVQYIQRFTGMFSANLDLRSFPLDRQRLSFWLVAPLIMEDGVQLHVNQSFKPLSKDSLSINDWHVDKIELLRREFTATASSKPAPGIELSIEVRRLFGYYIIQIIIPLFAIMLMAWTVFWIAPQTINVKVSVVITTMLTLIAYRFALGNHVPKLSYLTRLDWFLLGATTLVMIVLGCMAYSAYLVAREREKEVERIDRLGRTLYPIVVIIFTILVWLI